MDARVGRAFLLAAFDFVYELEIEKLAPDIRVGCPVLVAFCATGRGFGTELHGPTLIFGALKNPALSQKRDKDGHPT